MAYKEKELTKDDIQALYSALGDPYFDDPKNQKKAGTKKAAANKKAAVKRPGNKTATARKK